MQRAAIIASALIFIAGTVAQAAPSTRESPERAADAQDKIVCKRFVRTGSLASAYRTCKTKWEWERERENVRQFGVSDSCSARADPSTGSCM